MSTGCAQYQWQKHGASQTEFNRDKYECQSEAARIYPPRFVKNQITDGYTTDSTTNCYRNGYGNVSCTTSPGQHVKGVTSIEDVNKDNRNENNRQCMYARGWKLIRIK